MGAFLTTRVKVCLPICQLKIGWDRAADIAIRCGQDGSGIPVRGRDFHSASRPSLRHTHRPVQWVLGLFPGGKAAGA